MIDDGEKIVDRVTGERMALHPGSNMPTAAGPTLESINRLAQKQGHDAARDALLDHLNQHPEHGAFSRWLAQPSSRPPLLASWRRVDVPGVKPIVGVVPGSFYRERGTAENGQFVIELARMRDYDAERVEVGSFGRPTESARTIREWMDRHHPRPIIFVSISKGSADLRLALEQAHRDGRLDQVWAWISLSGMPFGSPLADWILARWMPRWLVWLYFRHLKQPFAALSELRSDKGTMLHRPLELPGRLPILSVVGFPSEAMLRGGDLKSIYHPLEKLGPQDGGGTRLADVLRLPGLVHAIKNANHAIGREWEVATLIPRLFRLVEAIPLESPRERSC